MIFSIIYKSTAMLANIHGCNVMYKYNTIKQETGGMKGADVAAAPITITSGRERAVDFLKPFQHLGITAIVRRPQQSAAASTQFTFGIFQPLQPALWGLILLSSFVVRFR